MMFAQLQPLIVLVFSAFLDYLVGDPWGWPHPVQFIGATITFFSQLILNLSENKIWRRVAGIFLGLVIIFLFAFISWLLLKFVYGIHFYLGLILDIILLSSCFAGRSLRAAAIDVLEPLKMNDMEQARSNLSKYVGRDTKNLSTEEIYRAVMETVTENAIDGVTAPLFYALVGSFVFPIGATPLAIAYKAASTLDSMIGYLKEPYREIGWFSAQLEDRLTWLPCRLSVFTLGLISKRPLQVWEMCRRDAIKDSSPNSGWSEGIYAAILGVQLGGCNSYAGVIVEKPKLGVDINPISAETISKALGLTRFCFLLWLFIATLVHLLIIYVRYYPHSNSY